MGKLKIFISTCSTNIQCRRLSANEVKSYTRIVPLSTKSDRAALIENGTELVKTPVQEVIPEAPLPTALRSSILTSDVLSYEQC